MATVTFKGIEKSYANTNRKKKDSSEKSRLAVKDFNLEIADKEFVVLVGPSGCGKSTTLRMVAGLEDISGGELYIDGKLVNDVEPKDRDIAMVFQSYALYPHMTVYNNIAFPLKLRKVPKEQIKEKVMEAARILDIVDFLDRKPKALSGGQRQRVAIGRAIVRDPKVLLMDEPLSNLDAKLRNQMRAEIIKLRQKIDATFIYVTHDQTEAMTLGDRIVIMKDGETQQVATPQEAFDRPANIFVAGFIGTPQMNFFEDSRLKVEDGRYYAEVLGMKVELSEKKQQILRSRGVKEQAVTVGVRPTHISLCGGENAIEAEVELSELMGSEVHLHVKNKADRNIIIVAPTVDSAGNHIGFFERGSKVRFTFNANVCHVFGEDGRNLEI